MSRKRTHVMVPRRVPGTIVLVAVLSMMLMSVVSAAGSFANSEIERTWERTDRAVAEHAVQRTWMWGPGPITPGFSEWYVDAPGEFRLVQYFDKSRMEITNPAGDRNADWYVTNGLLASELITGRLQVGDDTFVQLDPAEVPVAGDTDDRYGPTYATFWNKTYVPLDMPGTVIRRINRAGLVWDDASLARHGVTDPVYVVETNHRVASVFWNFMTSSGPVYRNGAYVQSPLFPNPYYATGYPITEPYWAEVKVGGVYRDVLMQCFERRCLTYTPGNPAGFEVEAGNIGLHYYIWRYGDESEHLSAIYLVSYSDNGSNGVPVGCGDSLVPVQRGFVESNDVATNARQTLEMLLALDDEQYGESGFVNTLHQSDLTVTSVSVVNGHATVALSGTLVLNGACDEPRAAGQIYQTVAHVDGVTSVSMTLNSVAFPAP